MLTIAARLNHKHFFALLSVVISQNLLVKFNALYDYSYIVNISQRISLGEIPWRDFDLMVTPGVFYIMNLAFEFFGYSHKTTIFITLVSSIFSFYFTFEILKKLYIFKSYLAISLISCIFSVNSILAFPFYDNFATLSILFSIFILLSLHKDASAFFFFVFGMSVFLPFMFKQNVGIFFALGIFFFICFWLAGSEKILQSKLPLRHFMLVLAGFTFTLLTFLSFLLKTGTLSAFLVNVFYHAAESKGLNLSTLLIQYFSAVSMILLVILSTSIIFPNSGQVSFLFLLFVGFLTIAFFVDSINLITLDESKNYPFNFLGPIIILGIMHPILRWRKFRNSKLSVPDFIPFIAAVSCFGAFTSQGFWGSNYSLWPMISLIIFPALLSPFIEDLTTDNWSIFITAVIGMWLIAYGFNGERFAFIDTKSSNTRTLTSNWNSLPLSESQESSIILISEMISAERLDVLEIPMEDPLPFYNDKVSFWGRCPQFNSISCQNLNALLKEFRENPPPNVILKKHEQLIYDPENEFKVKVLPLLKECYSIKFDSDTYILYSKLSETKKCISKLN